MNETELTNKAIAWLGMQCKSSTSTRLFTPKEVADAVGGYAGSIGKVQSAVVAELIGQGFAVKYLAGKKPVFQLAVRK